MPKRTFYLIVNGQTGEIRVRKNLSAGFGEVVYQLVLDFAEPASSMPRIELKLPAIPSPVVTIIKGMEYGLHWAMAQGYVRLVSFDIEGKATFQLTEAGEDFFIGKLAAGLSPDLAPFELACSIETHYGLPHFYFDTEQYDRIKVKLESAEQRGEL